jgi:hypothetical protein
MPRLTPTELRIALMEELGHPRGPDEVIAASYVRQGAPLGFDEERRSSPLLRAAYVDATEVVEAILKQGVPIDQQDNRGWTALMVAANRGNYKTVKLLCDNGADMHRFGNNGETAFSLVNEPAQGQPRMPRHDKAEQELVYAQKALNVKQAQAEAEAAISGIESPIGIMRPVTLKNRKGFAPCR